MLYIECKFQTMQFVAQPCRIVKSSSSMHANSVKFFFQVKVVSYEFGKNTIFFSVNIERQLLIVNNVNCQSTWISESAKLELEVEDRDRIEVVNLKGNKTEDA